VKSNEAHKNFCFAQIPSEALTHACEHDNKTRPGDTDVWISRKSIIQDEHILYLRVRFFKDKNNAAHKLLFDTTRR